MQIALTSRDNGITVVSIHGAIDLSTAPHLREAMHALFDAGQVQILIDLSGVDFCDSIGLSTFAYGHNHCVAAGGFLRLVAPTPFLANLMFTVGLTGPIPVHDTLADALRASPSPA